jgi:hypothetical protein
MNLGGIVEEIHRMGVSDTVLSLTKMLRLVNTNFSVPDCEKKYPMHCMWLELPMFCWGWTMVPFEFVTYRGCCCYCCCCTMGCMMGLFTGWCCLNCSDCICCCIASCWTVLPASAWRASHLLVAANLISPLWPVQSGQPRRWPPYAHCTTGCRCCQHGYTLPPGGHFLLDAGTSCCCIARHSRGCDSIRSLCYFARGWGNQHGVWGVETYDRVWIGVHVVQ